MRNRGGEMGRLRIGLEEMRNGAAENRIRVLCCVLKRIKTT